MDNLVYMLDGYDLFFILLLEFLDLWLIQLRWNAYCVQFFSLKYLLFYWSLRVWVVLQIWNVAMLLSSI